MVNNLDENDEYGLNNLSPEELQRIANGEDEPSQVEQTAQSFDQRAGELATAASQGLIQGVENFANGGTILLRNVTDALGITDKNKTDAIKQENATDRKVTELAAQKVDAEGLSKGFEVAGELAPNFALGSGIYGGAKALLGSGIKAEIGANALSGAGSSLIGNVTGGIGDNLESGAYGAVVGGVLGGIVGTAIKGTLAALKGPLKIDPSKAEALRSAGIQARASQVADSTLSPESAKFWQNTESVLSKIPFFGIRSNVKRGAQGYEDFARKIVGGLDNAPNPARSFWLLNAQLKPFGRFQLTGVRRTILNNVDALQSNKGLLKNEPTIKYMESLFDVPALNFTELHDFRQGIDATMSKLAGSLDLKPSRLEFQALKAVRNSVSDALRGIARKGGMQRVWDSANKEYADMLFASGIKDAFKASTSPSGRVFKGAAFNKNLDNKLAELKDNFNLDIPKVWEQGIKNLKIVSGIFADESTKIKPSAATSLFSVPSAATAGVGIGSVASGPLGVAIGSVAAAATKGLALLASTDRGIRALANLGKVSGDNPNVRLLVGSAIALGQASSEKDNITATQVMDRQMDDELSNMTPEQLQAVANGEE